MSQGASGSAPSSGPPYRSSTRAAAAASVSIGGSTPDAGTSASSARSMTQASIQTTRGSTEARASAITTVASERSSLRRRCTVMSNAFRPSASASGHSRSTSRSIAMPRSPLATRIFSNSSGLRWAFPSKRSVAPWSWISKRPSARTTTGHGQPTASIDAGTRRCAVTRSPAYETPIPCSKPRPAAWSSCVDATPSACGTGGGFRAQAPAPAARANALHPALVARCTLRRGTPGIRQIRPARRPSRRGSRADGRAPSDTPPFRRQSWPATPGRAGDRTCGRTRKPRAARPAPGRARPHDIREHRAGGLMEVIEDDDGRMAQRGEQRAEIAPRESREVDRAVRRQQGEPGCVGPRPRQPPPGA